jgi:hypothetical protein
MTDDIQEYIKKMREAGKSEDEIKNGLIGAGWEESDVSLILQSGKPMKKYLYIIMVVVIAALGGLFYYLYNTYPNAPEIILEKKGYQVTAVVKFPKEEILVKTFRQGELVSDFKKTGSYLLEYLPPGNHAYEFRYSIKNLFGVERDIEQSKQLTIGELTKDELGQYFDFPSLNITTAKYNVLISYTDLKGFSNLDIFRNKEKITTIKTIIAEEEIIENVSPDKYIYEIEFSGEEYKNLEGYLRQDYEIEVVPISPIIVSIQSTPLYQGYSTEITATVENASVCKAELLLYPPSGFESIDQTVLKSFEFNVGIDVDYFYQHTESWTWEEVLFPEPTDMDTTSYNMDINLSCSDYYNSINTEEVGKFSTGKDISPTSIDISYYRNESGIVFGEVTSKTWTDLDCRVLIGDQSNYTLDELNFLLQGRHVYEFNISDYSRNFLYVTAICKSDDSDGVTKISTYKAE